MARLPEKGMLLPWNREPGEQQRLALIFMLMLALFLPPALIIPMLEVPEREPYSEPPPIQTARMLEQVEPEVEREAEPEAEAAPEPAEEPAPEVAETEAVPPPETVTETVEEARAVARQSGLMALQDDLADLRELAQPQSSPLATDSPVEAGTPGELLAGPDAGEVTRGSGGAGVEGGGNVEQVALAGREATRLEGRAETGGDRRASERAAQRPMATIRETFDRNKSALFSIYNRALRTNPMLAGKVVLELVISPDGQVIEIRIVESELGDDEVERRIASRVSLFDFGAMNVPERTVQFPVDFLPP